MYLCGVIASYSVFSVSTGSCTVKEWTDYIFTAFLLAFASVVRRTGKGIFSFKVLAVRMPVGFHGPFGGGEYRDFH